MVVTFFNILAKEESWYSNANGLLELNLFSTPFLKDILIHLKKPTSMYKKYCLPQNC